MTEPAFPALPERDVAAKAFSRLEAEILALPDERLRRITLDVPSAVTVVLGALPRLAPHREAIAALPGLPGDMLERLRDAALAAYHAHLSNLPRPSDETERKRLVEEARPLRETLLIDAEALAHRRLLDPDRVARVRSGHGHLDTAGDLLALASLFAEAWPGIHDRTAATTAEIERAGDLGARLLTVLAEDPPASANWPDLRVRAFSLLVHLYDDLRRALAFLRHHEGDANQLAPSLYLREPSARKPEAPEATDAHEAEVA